MVEIDTDGVYFQPPPEVQTEADEIAFVERVGAVLPEGIRLAYDGRYRAMLSLKTKNYVLQGYDGKLTFKGASLRSRADEKFGREFLNSAIQWLLNGEPERVVAEYRRLARAILNGEVDIEQLCRRERVTQKSKQDTHPLYPLARRFQIGDYIMVYRKRDGSLGLLEEYAGDEDREHYVEKLYKFAARLEPLFPTSTRGSPSRRQSFRRSGSWGCLTEGAVRVILPPPVARNRARSNQFSRTQGRGACANRRRWEGNSTFAAEPCTGFQSHSCNSFFNFCTN